MQKSVALLISLALMTSLMSFAIAETIVTAEVGDIEDSVIIQGQAIAIQSAPTSATGTTATASSTTIVQKSSDTPTTSVSGGLKIEVATEGSTKVLHVVSASGVTTTIGVPPQTAITAAQTATGVKCPPLSVTSSSTAAGAAARIIAARNGCTIVIRPVPVPSTTPPATTPPSNPTSTTPTGTPSSTAKPRVTSTVPAYSVTVPVRRHFLRIFPTTIRSTVNVDVTTGNVISVDESLLVRTGLAN